MVAGVYYFEEKFALGEQLNMDTQYCNVLVPAGPGRTACAAYYASTGGVAATGAGTAAVWAGAEPAQQTHNASGTACRRLGITATRRR